MDDVQSLSDSVSTLSDQVAEELRALLARRRLSGRDLARRLDVSPSWVSYRLTGTTEIGLNDLEKIADALDVEVSALLPQPVRRTTGGTMTPSSHVATRPRSTRLTAEGCTGTTRMELSTTAGPHPGRAAGETAAAARTPSRRRTIAWTHTGVSR